MRSLRLALTVGLALLAATTAARAAPIAPALQSVHNARDATWHWQDAAHRQRTPYGWVADQPGTSAARRWWIATQWWNRAWHAHAMYTAWLRAQGGVPSWFMADMPCLARAEEYGPPWEGGYTTVAGYFGMISAPSSYPGSSSAVATYGDSWLSIPWAAQIPIVYAEWQAYGWHPWPNTAPGCGL